MGSASRRPLGRVAGSTHGARAERPDEHSAVHQGRCRGDALHAGTRVIVSSMSACGRCACCRMLMCSQRTSGGGIVGNRTDGTRAEFVRSAQADTRPYAVPAGGA